MISFSILDPNDTVALSAFCDGLNKAMILNDDFIPFSETSLSDIRKLLSIGNGLLIGGKDGNALVCGLCATFKEKNNVVLSKVWCLPEKQGNGYAKKLLAFAENLAHERNASVLSLNVVRANNRAFSLYRVMRYRALSVYAFRPGYGYSVKMCKPLKAKFSFNIKRLLTLSTSAVKFFLLFRSDATPRWIYKVIYEQKRN